MGLENFTSQNIRKTFFLKNIIVFSIFRLCKVTPEIEEKKFLEEYEKTLNLGARKFNSPKYKENFFWNKKGFSDCFLFLTFLRLAENCPKVALASNTPKTLTLISTATKYLNRNSYFWSYKASKNMTFIQIDKVFFLLLKLFSVKRKIKWGP